jgi:hypothetical protein
MHILQLMHSPHVKHLGHGMHLPHIYHGATYDIAYTTYTTYTIYTVGTYHTTCMARRAVTHCMIYASCAVRTCYMLH